MAAIELPQGANLTTEGVRYRLWAPKAHQATAKIWPLGENEPREIVLQAEADGYFSGLDPAGRAGDRYMFRMGGDPLPCPGSRFQPESVSGPAEVIDPTTFSWTDQAWRRPAFRDLVIYELHIGTFTPEGTYRAAISKLPYLVDLGINTIEIMPLADFPGAHNWGYDGVRLFGPARAYGRPDDLRALIDAAHAAGLAVILDAVYNHFGPDGNYLRAFSTSYFEDRHHTPWGEAINFSRSPQVREYFRANILYWMEEYHFDGFRLDATHAIYDDSPQHILAELATLVHERGGYIIGEDERNEARLISPQKDGGFGLDAVWADDFHHSVEVALIDASIYATEFHGEMSELVNALQNGWVHPPPWPAGSVRQNTACAHLPPERFVFCISNHDQAGNRAFGERLNHFVSPETYRAASALLCLTPYTPMLFMGQEWGASTPFLYFTDHNPQLGKLVEEGRRNEMSRHPAYQAALSHEDLPSPQAPSTFEKSKLVWEESERDGHGACLRLYREALKLRREHPVFRPQDRASTKVAALNWGVLAIRAQSSEEDWLLLCDLRGGHYGSLRADEFTRPPEGRTWHPILSSNGPQFGGPNTTSYDGPSCQVGFQLPEMLVFRAG